MDLSLYQVIVIGWLLALNYPFVATIQAKAWKEEEFSDFSDAESQSVIKCEEFSAEEVVDNIVRRTVKYLVDTVSAEAAEADVQRKCKPVVYEVDEEDDIEPTPQVATVKAKIQQNHRREGFNTAWLTEFSWLLFNDDAMFCSSCKDADLGGVFTKGNSNFRRDRLVTHAKSRSHAQGLRKLKTVTNTSKDIMEPVLTVKEQDLYAALKAMLYILKESIAFLKYGSLMDLLSDFKLVTQKTDLPGNANMRSEGMKNEIIECLGETVKGEILRELRAASCYSLMIDETLDIRTTEQMVVYTKYTCLPTIDEPAEVKTRFLGILELQAGDAQHIHQKCLGFLEKIKVSVDNMVGFGSDGAAVMVGSRSGVATLLKEQNPKVISIHCVAHRLALAVGSAAKTHIAVNFCLKKLDEVRSYYSKSNTRTSGFKSIQDALGVNRIELCAASATRWLSYDKSVHNFKLAYKPLLLSLEREEYERSCNKAHGHLSHIKTWKFVFTLEMLSSILPQLASLSKSFQTRNLSFSVIPELVAVTVNHISTVRDDEGSWCGIQKLAQAVVEENGLTPPTEEEERRFKHTVFEPFLKDVIVNLKERFPEESTNILSCASIFSANPYSTSESYGLGEIEKLASHYGIRPDQLLREWAIIRQAVGLRKCNMSLSVAAKGFHETALHLLSTYHGYNNLSNIIYILAALSVVTVTTADCERAFSLLKLTKTPLRNCLKSDNLNYAMLVAIEAPDDQKSFDLKSAVAYFSAKKKRRVV